MGIDKRDKLPHKTKQGVTNLNIETSVFPKSKRRAEGKLVWKKIQARLNTCMYNCKVEVNCHHVAISSHGKKILAQRG